MKEKNVSFVSLVLPLHAESLYEIPLDSIFSLTLERLRLAFTANVRFAFTFPQNK